MRNDKRRLTAAAAVSAVLFSSGCSAGGGSAPVQAEPSKAAVPVATRTPEESAGGSVEVAAPELPDGKVIAAVSRVHGNRRIPLEGGTRGSVLAIMVSCEGKGNIRVSTEPSGFVFQAECVAG